MSNLLRLIKSRFFHERDRDVSKHNEVFDEGSRGGFPSDVVSFDFHDGIIVVGTSNGDVVFYGSRGSSCYISLKEPGNLKINILKTVFASFNFVFVLCEGSLLIPLEINDGSIIRHRELKLDDNADFQWEITHMQKFKGLLFGMGDNIFRVSLEFLDMEMLIKQDDIKKWCAENNSITNITSYPDRSDVLLILSENGTCAVYNQFQFIMSIKLENFENEAIERIHWSYDCVAYGISCNNKYTKWQFSLSSESYLKAQEIGTYNTNQLGPYPCYQIRHFNCCVNFPKGEDEFIVYQGGNSTGKHDGSDLISVCHGDDVKRFFSSAEVIGITIAKSSKETEAGVVLVCTTSEIVALDLNDHCKMLLPSNLISINYSTPTCHAKTIEIEENVWLRLNTASKAFWDDRNMSKREWPLSSRKQSNDQPQRSSFRQVYISGHSNGNVCVWASGGAGLSLLFIIETSVEFGGVCDHECRELKINGSTQTSGQKIDFFDPFDDDESLCIARVHLDAKSGLVIVTNRGGFIFLYDLCTQKKKLQPWKPVSINGTSLSTGVLQPRTTDNWYFSGFQLLQKQNSSEPLVFMVPEDYQISDIAYIHKYHCLVIGTTKGVVFFDSNYGFVVTTENCEDDDKKEIIRENGKGITRFKSFKKSVRRTFRRKRKTNQLALAEAGGETNLYAPAGIEEAYVERQIDENGGTYSKDFKEPLCSVTCLRTMRLPIEDKKTVDDVVAVGLRDGTVVFYAITEMEISSQLTFKTTKCKSLLSSRSHPVLSVDITTDDGYFASSTKLIIITDEQLRVYDCQPFSKKFSYKLTALEGIKIKNGTVARGPKNRTQNASDSLILILANDGNIRVHSAENPSLFKKKQLIDPSDVIGLNSSCLCRDGTITYLIKSSVMQRHMINFDLSLSSKN